MYDYKITLYLPDMWDGVFHTLSLNKTDNLEWELEKHPLNVEQTGTDGLFFKNFLDEENNIIPIFLLPVAHCAANIVDYKLQIIGPVISTRNDIYLFRNIKNSRKKTKFKIGVREQELTTSNISRVLYHHWTPDMYFYASYDNVDHIHSSFINEGKVAHIPFFDPSIRLRRLLNAEIDAAIFMGKELSFIKSQNLQELIVAGDLNSMICNMYNTSEFPRAVFAIFKKETEDEFRAKCIEEFVDLYNNCIDQTRAHFKNSTQIPLLTGNRSNIDDINIQMKFTLDMTNSDLDFDREKDKEPEKPLELKDFIWWKDISYKSNLKLLLENLKTINLKNLFQHTSGDKVNVKSASDAVNAFIYKIEDDLKKGSDVKIDLVIKSVYKLSVLSSDEKTKLISHIQSEWDKF